MLLIKKKRGIGRAMERFLAVVGTLKPRRPRPVFSLERRNVFEQKSMSFEQFVAYRLHRARQYHVGQFAVLASVY